MAAIQLPPTDSESCVQLTDLPNEILLSVIKVLSHA